MPSLQLPPVPFGRTGGSPMLQAPAHGSLPSGTSIQDLLGALEEPAQYAPPATPPTDAPVRPFEEFSSAVDRRGRRERRSDARTTPDRRSFTSAHMAAPADGPSDPRPTEPPPVAHVATRPAPIDAVMPALPLPLEPAMPFELPSRGVAASTQRTMRAGAVSVPATPQAAFPSHAEPVPAPAAAPIVDVAPVPQPVGRDAIAGIFDAPSSVPMGHLEPRRMAPASAMPLSGPAGPSTAPGEGLEPVAAAVATAPSAWYGGAVQVDDAMMVWNAPGAQAPLAPSVAAMIAPQVASSAPAAPRAAATAAPLATSPLSAGAAPGPASTASSTTRGPLASLLRLLLVVGVPASTGIALAIAIDRFAF